MTHPKYINQVSRFADFIRKGNKNAEIISLNNNIENGPLYDGSIKRLKQKHGNLLKYLKAFFYLINRHHAF